MDILMKNTKKCLTIAMSIKRPVDECGSTPKFSRFYLAHAKFFHTGFIENPAVFFRILVQSNHNAKEWKQVKARSGDREKKLSVG